MPPLATVVPLAVPPIATTSKPPLLTVVPLVTPPDDTVTWPPLLTVVSTDVPPERTTRSVPLWTVMPEEVMPEEMKIVVIDPSPSRSGSSGARAPPVFQGAPHEALRH